MKRFLPTDLRMVIQLFQQGIHHAVPYKRSFRDRFELQVAHAFLSAMESVPGNTMICHCTIQVLMHLFKLVLDTTQRAGT